ncbi:MAG: Stk1 family PASTA domain-containing Ser/Thr kinase [Vulcanimicrobiaceae bacterium]
MIERNLAERYRLEEKIGQGGMGVVYAGLDVVLRRRVAIKVLRADLAADADFVQRFYTEAQHAAKLSHPNVVNVFDVGREGDRYFIVMELVEGTTLAALLAGGRALPEALAIDFAAQLAGGLAYAHRQGIVHRDVKPQNVLVTRDDVVKLSDFGIARATSTETIAMTQPGLVMGSAYYLSPEAAQGKEPTEASDLYSLGVVLFQMLTGSLPYTGDSPVSVALQHVSAPVPGIERFEGASSPALAAIVRRLLQKDPSDRFASASEVARALREAREPEPASTQRVVAESIPNPKPRPSERPDHPLDEREQRRPSRRPQLVVLLAAVLVLGALSGYLIVRHGLTSPVGKLVTVPPLAALSLADAQQRLGTLGLSPAIREAPSLSVLRGIVIRQDPVAGASVAAGSSVTLDVSSGLPQVTLLDLGQYSSGDAQRYLRNAHLKPKLVAKFDQAPPGTVLSQNPAAGTQLAVHSVVTLVVSKGPPTVALPDLVTMSAGDAERALAAAHLRATVSQHNYDGIPVGVVAEQSPSAGTALAPGSSVQLVVSAGPVAVSVPDLGQQTLASARTMLHNAGLAIAVEYAVDANSQSGAIVGQSPAAGSALQKGQVVTLTVAVPGAVPNVAGMVPAQAASVLEAAGYAVGNTAYVQEGTDGTVVRTDPPASTQLAPGETVDLYVSGVSPLGPATPGSAAPSGAATPNAGGTPSAP